MIFISSDHGGYELKEYIKKHLTKKNISLTDLGPFQIYPEDDYVDYAILLCRKVQETQNSRGLLICRSGIGMSIVANKFKGIYAGLCFSVKHAETGRKHNNINVLCLDSDYSSHSDVLGIVDVFLNTTESNEDRHVRRRNKIQELEDLNFCETTN